MVNEVRDTYDNRVDHQEDLWNCYNALLLSPDRSRIRKLLIRYRLFELTLNIPGDIVECGVFKGAGLLYWAKLLDIFAPASRKRVIGFDLFGPFKQAPLQDSEKDIAALHDQITDNKGCNKAEIEAIGAAAGFANKIELVKGDIGETSATYVAQHYGFRISLLHLDLDTYAGTKAALKAFWPIVSRGGVIIFDEYALAGFGESQAVDEFFADMDVKPLVVPYAETPTAYLIKP